MNTNPKTPGRAESPLVSAAGRGRVFGKVVAGICLSCALLIWMAWTFLCPLFAAESTAPTLNGSWTLLSKPQPLGHVSSARAVAIDGKGELYVADTTEGGRIQKRDLNGNWTLVASTGQSPGGLKDGVRAMAFDLSGSLYVAEPERICKRDSQGNWTTLATKGKELGQVNGPGALALDREGNLYVADGSGEESQVLLRRPDGQWTRLAGRGDEVGEVIDPQGLAVDAEGNLYIADKPPQGKRTQSKRIQKRDRTGRWSVVDEDAMSRPGLGSPLATVGNFDKMTAGAGGALYVSATGQDGWPSSQLLKRDTEGRWTQLAVRGEGLGQVLEVTGMSVDSAGALYLAEPGFGRPRVHKRDSDGTWTVVSEALNGPGFFLEASSLTVDSRGNLYVVDRRQGRVQKRDSGGRWTVVVELPGPAIFLDNPSFPVGLDPKWPLPFWLPVFYLFGDTWSVAVDRQDNLYVAEWRYNRVMKLNARGEWEVCMPAGKAVGQTENPTWLSVDASDNLYVISGGGRLDKRDPKGRWTVLANTNNTQQGIFGVCAAPNGDAYVYGDINRQWGVHVLTSHGGWTTVATNGSELGQVEHPVGIATDAIGRLYLADGGNHRLQVRDVDGKWSLLAAAKSYESPQGIAVDRHGVVYFSDAAGVVSWTPQPKAKAATGAAEKRK